MAGEMLPASTVIGNGLASFQVHIPQIALLTLLKKMIKDEACLGQTEAYTVQNIVTSVPVNFDLNSQDAKAWHRVYVNLSEQERKQLKIHLIQALAANTLKPKDGEDVWLYLQRMAQRRTTAKKASKVGDYKVKSITTTRKDRDAFKKADKWGSNSKKKEK